MNCVLHEVDGLIFSASAIAGSQENGEKAPCFSALRNDAIGTKRTFAAPQHFVRYWSNNGQVSIFARDGLSANDPKRTLLLHLPSTLALSGNWPARRKLV